MPIDNLVILLDRLDDMRRGRFPSLAIVA